MKKYTIYKITNITNGKIYIGSHITTNLDDGYMGSGSNIKLDIKKYGLANFKKDILFVFENKEDMINKEIEIVNEEFIEREDTYNIIKGGGFFCTEGVFQSKIIMDKLLWSIKKTNDIYLEN